MESNVSENEIPSNNLSDYLDRLEKSAGSNRDTDGLGTMAAGTFVVGSVEAINGEDGKEAHGPVRDVHYLVEADTEDDAIERLSLWLCDPDDDNAEGIEEFAVTSLGTTASTAPVE